MSTGEQVTEAGPTADPVTVATTTIDLVVDPTPSPAPTHITTTDSPTASDDRPEATPAAADDRPGPRRRAADPFSLTEVELDGDTAFAFDGDAWVDEPTPVPATGWRRRVWAVTGGRINPGPTPEEQRLRERMEAIRRPFGGARTLAVVSTKGGVGKTTTTLNLGHTLASIRGDRVVALDANPDAGSLGHRVRREHGATSVDLLAEADHIFGYGDVRHFTSQAESLLEVVASDDDPLSARRMGRPEYERLLNVLRVHYNLVLADCGTGILDAATRGVVQRSDQLVVVTGPSVDSARAVSYLLAWLREHGQAGLVERAVVVVNGVRQDGSPVDIDALVDHFAAQVRAVRTVPWDEELANGAVVELDWLAPATRQAYVQLAAAVVDGLGDEVAGEGGTGR